MGLELSLINIHVTDLSQNLLLHSNIVIINILFESNLSELSGKGY